MERMCEITSDVHESARPITITDWWPRFRRLKSPIGYQMRLD